MERVVEAEWLDELPAEDREAIRSRRDLQRVNGLMGNARAAARNLLQTFRNKPPTRLLEIGAGDGTFFLEVARRLAPRWRGITLVLLDRQSLVRAETLHQFCALSWSPIVVTDDVFRWLELSGEKFDAVVSNLFLHHFSETRLKALFESIAHQADACLALEPRRAVFAMSMSRLLWFVGCNRVTRHDAVVSVRAGFSGVELTRLWPAAGGWRLTEHETGLFSHFFRAMLEAG